MRIILFVGALLTSACSLVVDGKLDDKPAQMSSMDAGADADVSEDARIVRPDATEVQLRSCDDSDGDGFYVRKPCESCICEILPLDCNDDNPDAYPGANKGCGAGIDFDCNGTPDEDEEFSGYVDKDHDGFGTNQWGIVSSRACGAHPDAHLAPAGGDCDDEDYCDLPDATNAWWVSACGGVFMERTCE